MAQAESVAGQLKDRLDDGISDPSRAKSLLEKARTTAGKVADQAPPKVEDDWNTLVDGAHKLDPLVRDLADGKTDSVDLGKIWKSLGNSQMKIANSAAAIRADAKTRCQ